MMKNVFILGSINYDLVISCDKMPQSGETLHGSGFFTNSGGKGANQAVAISKLGGNAYMIGGVGTDSFGKECKATLQSYNVNLDFVQEVKFNTGVAVIVLANKDNRIILDSGANFKFDKTAMLKAIEKNVKQGDIFVAQLEIPLDYVKDGLQSAKKSGATTILNPAPAVKLSAEILQYVDIIVPNETELEILTDEKDIDKAAKQIKVKEVIVTLGSKGCYYKGKIYPIYEAKVVDTTAAGDTFIGALAAQLANGKAIEDSIDFCQKACAVKVSRKGAQIGIPTIAEVLQFK